MSNPSNHPVDLLPFFVNGTLPADEHGEVAAHLAQCEECRGELAFLQTLHAGVRQAEAVTVTELGWQRLQREIRGTSAKPRAATWLPWALAASLVLVMVQGVLLLQRTPDSAYQPVGALQQEVLLQVRFQPRATEAEIRALLQSIDGRIVDGPGALGIYRIRITADRDVAAALAVLRQRPELVAYAGRD